MKLRFGSFSTVILLGFLSVFLQYPSVQHCGIFCVLMEDWLVNPQTRGSHSMRRSEKRSCLMVSALDSASRGPGLRPGEDYALCS